MKCRLGDLARVSSSKRIYAKEYTTSGIPFYRGKEIIELGSGHLVSNKLFISKDRFNQIRSKYDDVPEKDDVLITAVGTIGETYLVKSRDLPFYFKDGNLIKLSKWNRQIVLPEYMYYWLNSYTGKMAIKKITIGSTQQAITIRELSDIELDLPPIREQGKIAQRLSTLDFSIDNNKHINANLDELMSEIFERYVTEANVFTTDSLSNIANYKNGLAMQRFRPNGADKGLPVLKIKELNQGFTDSSSDRCSSKISNDVIVKTGDIIFSWSGTLIVKIWTGTTCGLNQHLFKVTSDKYPKWFIYKWTEYYLRQFQSIAAGKATTMGHIKRSDLKQAEVKIPHKSEIDRLDKLISPIFKRYVNNILEINSLKELKNELLSKIF
ncbi:restriction endonuclease subunit S [Limosilactobacillus fermentum]|uniref:restriction endonuclease subunit S n=2 Tax=Limosilactobacillus fermentum TaxID=1613 RepID=UPI0020B2D7BB|nr:restriction endonuclease subunit S [Limosilactobacillus fermentum]UTF47189.1 restriction endonuclease subunit S [Limosilactobacillus fermentum]